MLDALYLKFPLFFCPHSTQNAIFQGSEWLQKPIRLKTPLKTSESSEVSDYLHSSVPGFNHLLVQYATHFYQ